MISKMCLKLKHSHVLISIIIIILSFLFQRVNSSTISLTFNQLVAVAANNGGVMNKQIKCIDKERNALLGFKAMILQDPFDSISTWGARKEDVDDDCCKWSRVTCNNQTGHVTELDLYERRLEGEISPSLLNLTYLTRLDLPFNNFNGTIPSFIGSMTQLKYLDLSNNAFHGSIPKSIGSLTELTHLDLSRNSFSGSILMSVGSLTELTHLDLSGNSFSGSIPKFIGSLTELRLLRLSSNSFRGNIPVSIGSLTKLTDLDLSHNSFSGNIPPEFGNLVNLEFLSLNNLGGCSVENISWLSHLSHLRRLFLSEISLAKADHWVNAILSLQNLTTLNLEGCDLSKVMRPYFSSSHVNSSSSSPSSNNVELYLNNNNLNSSMYAWLYPLTSTRSVIILDLSGNKLDEIPKYLGDLCLVYLNIDNNTFTGSISGFLRTLSIGCTSNTLYSLKASSSRFTGSIPDDIQHFSSLKDLNLSHNQLDGTISEKIGKLELRYIDISSNNINGKAPDLLSSFNSSSTLDLSSNNFYGPITNISSALNLLNLSKNKFYGGISFLCQLDGSLTDLDLSHNSFSGKIPDCLWHLKELKLLNLAHNNLSGRLPASVEYLIQLDVLNLYNNNFSGELPLSLRNCTKLTFLDLGANRFSGNVPVWIGESLSGLYVLSLGSNDFFGTIPLQFCHLVNLQILDLSMNNINGIIPSCVNNLTSMVQKEFLSAPNLRKYGFHPNTGYIGFREYTDHLMVQWQGIRREFSKNLGFLKSIDLSSNNLTGEIPDELSDLHVLFALNLSKNALLGEIPHKIGQLKEVQILDLSSNNLSGGLPSTMSQLTFLNYLDVSNNNLSGKIPTSTQLQSFGASRYIGNAGLCGPPVTKSCPGNEELHVPSSMGEREGGDEGDKDELGRWFYIGGAVGFAIGFWIVCITLLVIRHGRHTFFQFMDTLEDWVYVKVLVCKAKFQRGSS